MASSNRESDPAATLTSPGADVIGAHLLGVRWSSRVPIIGQRMRLYRADRIEPQVLAQLNLATSGWRRDPDSIDPKPSSDEADPDVLELASQGSLTLILTRPEDAEFSLRPMTAQDMMQLRSCPLDDEGRQWLAARMAESASASQLYLLLKIEIVDYETLIRGKREIVMERVGWWLQEAPTTLTLNVVDALITNTPTAWDGGMWW